MISEPKILTFQLSEGYRSVRRTVSLLCAIALAWSSAQFDIKTINLGIVGELDLSRATIPLILASAIAYSAARCALEFAMQSVEIRRWRLAQMDIKLSIFLVRATILVLAAGGLHRSIDTVFYVILAAVGVLIGSFAVIYLASMSVIAALAPIKAHAVTTASWVQLIASSAFIVFLALLGFASLYYEPLRELWTVPPSPIALGLFWLACIAVILSMVMEVMFSAKLFADPPLYTEKMLPNGRIGITFLETPPRVWDWYSQPVRERDFARPPFKLSPRVKSRFHHTP